MVLCTSVECPGKGLEYPGDALQRLGSSSQAVALMESKQACLIIFLKLSVRGVTVLNTSDPRVCRYLEPKALSKKELANSLYASIMTAAMADSLLIRCSCCTWTCCWSLESHGIVNRVTLTCAQNKVNHRKAHAIGKQSLLWASRPESGE